MRAPATRRWSRASSTSSASSSPARPRRCSPSRASSSSTARASTSACATTSPTRSSRSRSTRTSRACTSRASATAPGGRTSGPTPTPSACAARSICSRRSSCSAPAPAPSRGGAAATRAWTTTSSAARRPASGTSPGRTTAHSIDGVIDFLSGRFKAIERDLEERMRAAAAAQEFEQATLERNRLRAVHSLLERQRVANESVGTLDAVAVALDGREANAQVFQVRDGVLSDRQSFYLANETERGVAEVAEEFMLQYYAGHMSIPPQIVVQREVCDRSRAARSPTRSPPGAAGPWSCARPSAATSAASSSSPSATRASRSTRSTCAPSAAARAASTRWRACSRRSASTRCRCGSSASTSPTSAARTRSPRWSCSRAARRRSRTTAASRSARFETPAPTTTPRWPRC